MSAGHENLDQFASLQEDFDLRSAIDAGTVQVLHEMVPTLAQKLFDDGFVLTTVVRSNGAKKYVFEKPHEQLEVIGREQIYPTTSAGVSGKGLAMSQ